MTPRLLSGKMLWWYSMRLRIYSWPMIYLPPKLASAGVIASDVGRHQQCTCIAAYHLGTLDIQRMDVKHVMLESNQKMVYWWTDPEDGRTYWSTCLDRRCCQAGAN